ncbi:MAG: hypothetical protein Q7S21_00170 [archaeon]|nr:hypothetical protein [archaeon]
MVLVQKFEPLNGLKKLNFIELSVILMFFALLNIFVEFFPFSVLSVLAALFLPGYLLAKLILEKLDYLESIIFGIVLSIGLEVIMVLILVKVFAFPFNKLTILESALLLCIALIALIELKRFFNEYTIVKD